MAERIEKDPYSGNWRMPEFKEWLIIFLALTLILIGCTNYLAWQYPDGSAAALLDRLASEGITILQNLFRRLS